MLKMEYKTEKIKILHFEDDANDRELVKSLLLDGFAGCELVQVETKNDFIDALKKNRFDLILTDYKLPQFDGLSALKIARKIDPFIPCILISGTIGEDRAIDCLKEGATDFILKEKIFLLVIAIKRVINESKELYMRRQAEEALKNSEAEYRNLVDNALIGIYKTTVAGEILFVNKALAQILEFKSPKDLISTSVVERYRNPDDRKLLIESLNKKGSVSNFETELVTQKKNMINVILSARLEGNIVTGMILDNTERKKAEIKIRRQFSQLSALRNIDMAITSSLDIRVTLNIFLENVLKQMRVDAADVLLLDKNTQMLEYSFGVGFKTDALKYTSLHLGEGYAGIAAKERTIINIPDLTRDMNGLKSSPLLAEEGFVRYLAVPLITKGHIVGVLEIFKRTMMEISESEEWFGFLDTLATQAAIAIENANLFNDLQKSNLELSLAYDMTLEGWSKALDIRDKETEGHTLRVTNTVLRLAKVFDIKGSALVHIRRGSLLHDIGKLSVPDSILFKPSPLSEEEFAVMKEHTVMAYELISPISFLIPSLDIPYCHHEKWDGTGYPRGLKGEQIPLAARIFAVVDVWDALNSERPYRSAWPESKIKKYLIQQSGRHFDPEVVNAFLNLKKIK